jgi:hypothetical protein
VQLEAPARKLAPAGRPGASVEIREGTSAVMPSKRLTSRSAGIDRRDAALAHQRGEVKRPSQGAIP